MLVYENQEDFLEKLNTLEKTTAVYMTVVHSNQNESHVAVIRIQFTDGSGVFHTFNYTENIAPVPLLDRDVVDVLPTDELKKQVLSKYKADIDKLNEDIKNSFDKIKLGLGKLGFNKVINAYSV